MASLSATRRVPSTPVQHLGSRVIGETPPAYRASLVLKSPPRDLPGGQEPGQPAARQRDPPRQALLRQRLEEFRWKVGDLIEYPFEHADAEISLSRYVLATVPPKEEIGLLLGAADDSVQRVIGTFGRALGRLTHAAEEVEQALGLPPSSRSPHNRTRTGDLSAGSRKHLPFPGTWVRRTAPGCFDVENRESPEASGAASAPRVFRVTPAPSRTGLALPLQGVGVAARSWVAQGLCSESVP